MFFDDENKDLIEENKEIPQEETHEYVENNQDIPDEILNEEIPQEVVEPAKPNKKQKGKVRKTIEWILTGLFAAVFIVFAAAQIDGMVHKKEHFNQEIKFGFSTWVVWTDSMEPDYMVGSALVNYLDDEQTIIDRFNRGETVDITFWSNELYPFINPTIPYLTREIVVTPASGVELPIMTHRLVEIQKVDGVNYFITTGINYTEKEYSKKEQYQVFTYEKVLGVVKHNSPALGAFFKFVSSIWGLLILLLVPALYLAVTSIIDILKTLKENEEAPATGGAPQGVSSLDQLSEKDKERLKREMLEEMLAKKQQAKEKKDEEN